MKYVVEITEKFVKHVVVDADSEREAEDEVLRAHYKGKVFLGYDNYDDVEFDCIRRADDEDIKDYVDVGDL